MRYCNIADPPVYTEEIERWDRETDADGEAMGKVIEQLVNNDHYHKMSIERSFLRHFIPLSCGNLPLNHLRSFL